jgi:hypothetical protein
VAEPWRYGLHAGLNLDDLEHTAEQEKDFFLNRARNNLVPLYVQTSHSVWLENRPDMMKLHHRILPEFSRGLPEAVFMMSVGQLHLYIYMDWEVGITNEFKVMQGQGITKAQLMEIVMSAQIYGGVRALEAVYRATWPFIRDFQDRPVATSPFPADWDYDISHFKSGLDQTTLELTADDRHKLEDWYVKNGGEVPKWVTFMATYRPEFLKAYRLRWEGIFRGALPRQVMPFVMVYQAVYNGDADGLREAVLLGKAWGLTREWLVLAMVACAYYYTNLQGLNMVEAAVGDILGAHGW